MSMSDPVVQVERRPRRKGLEFRLEFRMLFLTLILLVVLSLSSKYFLTYNNIMNVLDQSVVVGILAVGQTAVVLTGGIDLSVGALVGLGGMVLALTGTETGFLPSLILGLAAGGLAGAVNGFLVVKARIAPFIVTLGMLSAARSLTYVISGAASITDLPPMLIQLATGTILGIPIDIVFLAVLYVAAWWYFAHTKGGRTIYAIGSNPEAARVAGLPIGRYTVGVYVVAGVLSALAAAFMAGRIRAVDPTSGTGLELDSIAAVVIGGASLFGGRGSMIGTFFGVIIMVCIRNGLNLMGIDPYWQGMAVGCIIVAAVAGERLLSGRRSAA
jgi:ribose transport system permease protein